MRPLKHGFEGQIQENIKGKGKRERRRKQLLDSPKETRGYWKFKEEH
jgi:hypothetical protein